ncbi:MAG: hypothetical protein JJU45_03975 [Acidimicrobiia bacterium]|nr:hypothetical protein [Acidimicrobiia bacterium]
MCCALSNPAEHRPKARAFYLHLIPELLPSPTDELHLVLLTKDAKRTLLER